MSPRAVSALLLTAALLAAASAHARQSDRDQPMDIHSGHQVGGLNDGEPIIMSRGVVITRWLRRWSVRVGGTGAAGSGSSRSRSSSFTPNRSANCFRTATSGIDSARSHLDTDLSE